MKCFILHCYTILTIQKNKKVYKDSKGISLNSFLEHKHSPNKIMIIIWAIFTIHQSQVDGIPPYNVQAKVCIAKRVTEKSRHFFAFSTMMAKRTALQVFETNENQMEWKKIHVGEKHVVYLSNKISYEILHNI